jgi:4-hydroxy-4-methyl-2-oxoglutarate aldolase
MTSDVQDIRGWARKPTKLRSALVADALDSLGYRAQCLSAGISALADGEVLVGTAFPVQIETVDALPDVPYVGLLSALDAIGPDDVYVAAVDGQARVAIWGELVTTACLSRGARGAVVDGYARDTALIRDRDFPVFSRGRIPTDSNGRSEVRLHNVPVTIDGVLVRPGDLVVADDDGVAIVPAEVIDQVVRIALDKNEHESEFRTAVAAGMLATDAFRKFGVL